MAAWTREIFLARFHTIERSVLPFYAKSRAKLALAKLESALSATRNATSRDVLMDKLAFVFLILDHAVWHGGLKASRVSAYQELAADILALAKIEPGRSALAFLHGELHDLKARLAAANGDVWSAAIETLLAGEHGGGAVLAGTGALALARAERALRLGDALEASRCAGVAATDGGIRASPARLVRTRVVELVAARLAGNEEHWRRCASAAAADGLDPGLPIFEPLAWEEVIGKATFAGEPERLAAAVMPRSPHANPARLLEAKMWFWGAGRRRFSSEIPDSYLLLRRAANRKLDVGDFHRSVFDWERAHDTETPVEQRVALVAEILQAAPRFATIEQELLTLVVASRWFQRVKSDEGLRFASRAYASLSMRVTGGRSEDALRISGMADQRVASRGL